MGNKASKRSSPQDGGVAAGGSDNAALALERELAEAQQQAELLAQMKVPDLPDFPEDDNMGDGDPEELPGMIRRDACTAAPAVANWLNNLLHALKV